MKSWEDFLWLFTQPPILLMFAIGMALPLILKFLRKFYPKQMQQTIVKSEALAKELEQSDTDQKLQKKTKKIEGAILFGPGMIALFAYLLYKNVTGLELTPELVIHSFAFITGSILCISFGVYALNHDKLMMYLLKEDYQRYSEINEKTIAIDPPLKIVEKYLRPIAYSFLLLGILSLSAFMMGWVA